jgi:hypothetical protein
MILLRDDCLVGVLRMRHWLGAGLNMIWMGRGAGGFDFVRACVFVGFGVAGRFASRSLPLLPSLSHTRLNPTTAHTHTHSHENTPHAHTFTLTNAHTPHTGRHLPPRGHRARSRGGPSRPIIPGGRAPTRPPLPPLPLAGRPGVFAPRAFGGVVYGGIAGAGGGGVGLRRGFDWLRRPSVDIYMYTYIRYNPLTLKVCLCCWTESFRVRPLQAECMI